MSKKVDEILEMFRPFAEMMAKQDEEHEEMYKAICGLNRNITVKEMAAYWKVSTASLYGPCRYLLPRFGEKRPGAERYTCTKEEFRQWALKGRDELRREFQMKALREQSDFGAVGADSSESQEDSNAYPPQEAI